MKTSRTHPGQPPVAREEPVRHKHHGVVRVDPWHWLRERDNPRVIAHLQAENAYTEAFMAPSAGLVDKLYGELISRNEESNTSAVYPDGPYLYQSRIARGENYRRYYRCPRSREGAWELYFDANLEAGDNPYFDLGFLDISPDGRLLAYAVDITGDEVHTLRFRDLESGQDLPDVIREVSPDGEWDASSRLYYYLLEDEARRPDRIMRHRIGTDPASDVVVYREEDVRFFAGIDKSQDGTHLFASSQSQETTEVHALRADDPDGAFIPLWPRREGIQYGVEHQEGHWLVRTNEAAPDFKLLRLPVGRDDLSLAEVLLPARKDVRLTDVLPLRHHLVLFERSRGLDQIRVLDQRTGEAQTIAMPDEVYDLSSAVNAEYDTCEFAFSYSSPIRPSLTFRYNLETRERVVIRSTTVPCGHRPEDYTAYRIQATARDGMEIPVTVFHRRDLALDGSHPAYLYGYGAYGESVEAAFRPSWLTWLQRGFVVAIAHVRGGGLLGEHWYQDGKLQKKENSFEDFIACAEALIEGGYTARRQIAIEGGSAGGLLIGAVLNRRPDLFRAAVASVPFVDVLTTMLDPDLPLTTFEYEEWGNPEDKAVFDTLLAYSPYDNVRPSAYPALLVTAGFHDPRVPYWEAAKWVAKLRKNQIGAAPILLKTNLETGHMGASGRYAYWRELAFEQAFLLGQMARPAEPPSDIPHVIV